MSKYVNKKKPRLGWRAPLYELCDNLRINSGQLERALAIKIFEEFMDTRRDLQYSWYTQKEQVRTDMFAYFDGLAVETAIFSFTHPNDAIGNTFDIAYDYYMTKNSILEKRQAENDYITSFCVDVGGE